ncbi:MAG: polyprenyl synthetase family protein [Gemmatimonadales bacterium]|nr:polyprenyl synthetase family protein [Gemmatimonadales bacterium]
MSSEKWQVDLDRERSGIDRRLQEMLRSESGIPRRLKSAMGHSLLGGGKRLRPVLLLWTWDAVSQGKNRGTVSRTEALSASCALEMLHTYSLVHDDLPAMDDDVLRRGNPTCHVAFDEATAILAGDGLQALAFKLLARHGGSVAGPLVEMLGQDVGPAGMVGGQQIDLDSEGMEVTAARVRRIQGKKTGALLAAAMGGGALLAGADPGLTATLHAAGFKLGLAFQGADDLLDVSAPSVRLGKSAGKDEASGKATWIRVEGMEKAKRRTRRVGLAALRSLEEALPDGPELDRLCFLGKMMWNRDR